MFSSENSCASGEMSSGRRSGEHQYLLQGLWASYYQVKHGRRSKQSQTFYITVLPVLPYSSQICSAIDMIIKHISIEFLGSEFQTLKKTFQGSKQLWRWARTRSSHGGKAWRLAAANKNNKYVTSLRRKHFLCILFTQLSRLEHAPIPIWKLSPLSRVLLMYLLKIFSVPEPFYVHFFLKVKGYLLHFCGAKKNIIIDISHLCPIDHGCVDISMSSVG